MGLHFMNRTPGQRFLSRLVSWLPGLNGLFALAVIPGVLIGLGLSYAIYQNGRTTLEQGSLQTARALLRAVDSDLATVESLALALSQSELLREGRLEDFHRQASDVIRLAGVGHNAVVSNLQGQQLLNTAMPTGAKLPEHGDRAQFVLALQSGHPVLSNLYRGPVLGRLVISVDVPVLRNGEPVYVLSLGILPDHFNALMAGQGLPEGWIATVLDSTDVVVGRNRLAESTVGKSATPDLRKQIALHGQGIMSSRSLEGIPTFIAFAKSGLTGWTIVVGMNQSVLYEELYDLQLLVALAVVGLLVSGVLFSWLFGTHMRRSLRALGSAIEGTPDQDGPALAPTNSGIREIDQLARKFNAMQETNLAMEQRIRDMAFHDPLTGLANRRLLVDRLEQTLARNHRGGEFAALLFFDLDNFKPLNDTHGHGAGDVLLEEVAVRLQGQVRETDTVARFGGDEFVVLLTRLGSEPVQAFEQASALAETLRDVLSRPYELVTGQEGEPTVQHVCTASVGVAVFSTELPDADAVVDQADAAMYRAKQAGRNRVVATLGRQGGTAS